MVLKKINIKNFKGIEECTIDLKEGFNLLIGDNGFGKTSILEAISVGLGGFIAGIEDVSTKHFTKEEIRLELEYVGDGSFNRRFMTPVEVGCVAEVNGEIYEWNRKKNSLNASRTTVEPRTICKVAYKMANEKNYTLPVLSYQSTARMWMQKREASEDIFAQDFHRTVGYSSCLVEASDIKMLMNWIRRMEQLEWKRKKQIGEYLGVKSILRNFMKCMVDENVLNLEYDNVSGELIFVTETESLPIRHLSSGYQSLIWMILDIACRMAILNPDMLERINEAPGVVLIDEIDMHLHPKWQWKIVEALKTTFPNVQFIAATHSPIVIASCKEDNLITIREDKTVSYAQTPYGFDVNETLSVFQESSTMVKEVETLFKKFYQSLDDEMYENAEEYLQKLKLLTGENNPKVTGAEVSLQLEQIPLED